MTNISSRLKDLRKALGLSQEGLAQRMRFGRHYISLLERDTEGKRQPSQRFMLELESLEREVDVLITREEAADFGKATRILETQNDVEKWDRQRQGQAQAQAQCDDLPPVETPPTAQERCILMKELLDDFMKTGSRVKRRWLADQIVALAQELRTF